MGSGPSLGLVAIHFFFQLLLTSTVVLLCVSLLACVIVPTIGKQLFNYIDRQQPNRKPQTVVSGI